MPSDKTFLMHKRKLQFITGILFFLSYPSIFFLLSHHESKKRTSLSLMCNALEERETSALLQKREKENHYSLQFNAQLRICRSSTPDNSLVTSIFLPHKFGNGICHTMMVDTISSCLDCFVFLLTLLWPSPPDTTNTELTLTL